MPSLLITGSRKGIGRAIAEHYLAHGWTVYGCSRTPADWTHERYTHYTCDVSNAPAVRTLVRSVEKASNGIDALVNNAGIAAMNALLLTPASTAQDIFATNTLGTFYVLQEVAKGMCRRKSGRIVNFSSIAHPLNLEGEAIYAASKAAVESITRIAAREFGPYGVTVNAIGPTAIDTDLVRTVPKAKLEELRSRQAIPRAGTAGDVIHAVDFFLQPKSDFITGQVLYLGGV